MASSGKPELAPPNRVSSAALVMNSAFTTVKGPFEGMRKTPCEPAQRMASSVVNVGTLVSVASRLRWGVIAGEPNGGIRFPFVVPESAAYRWPFSHSESNTHRSFSKTDSMICFHQARADRQGLREQGRAAWPTSHRRSQLLRHKLIQGEGCLPCMRQRCCLGWQACWGV